jgi:DNA polymerase
VNRNEAILRELNLYPAWVARSAPVAPQELPAQAANTQADVDKPMPIAPVMTQQVEERTVETELSAQAMPDLAPSSAEQFQPAANAANWPELQQQVSNCSACKLRAGCQQTVFGVGDKQADWLFVGEGPGADEDAQGDPFVGQAGKLLDNMLTAIKLKRGNKVYIANVVKCRPPSNRIPEADEVATCLPYLQRQIELIQPKLIVALGKTAATSLLGRDATLGSLRGTVHDYRGIPLIVTYHPSYLLRAPSEKAKAWQDLCFALTTHAKITSR